MHILVDRWNCLGKGCGLIRFGRSERFCWWTSRKLGFPRRQPCHGGLYTVFRWWWSRHPVEMALIRINRFYKKLSILAHISKLAPRVCKVCTLCTGSPHRSYSALCAHKVSEQSRQTTASGLFPNVMLPGWRVFARKGNSCVIQKTKDFVY